MNRAGLGDAQSLVEVANYVKYLAWGVAALVVLGLVMRVRR